MGNERKVPTFKVNHAILFQVIADFIHDSEDNNPPTLKEMREVLQKMMQDGSVPLDSFPTQNLNILITDLVLVGLLKEPRPRVSGDYHPVQGYEERFEKLISEYQISWNR